MENNKMSKQLQIVLGGMVTLLWAMVCAYYWRKTGQLSYELGLPRQVNFFYMRAVLLTIPYLFIMIWIRLGNTKFGEVIYKYRFWIACGLFVVLVLCKINYSSMSMYNSYVQPGTSTIFGYPLFGEARAIRSDEWMVTLPRLMSTDYAGYGLKNSIVRGTVTDNLSASGLYLSFSSLAHPADWGYYIFGDSAYGLAWNWNFKLIFGFLAIFELVMIMTKGNKRVSLFGAVLIWFSTFSVWWSMVTSLFTGSAAVVLFYYFLKEKNIGKRILYGLGMGVFISNFVVDFYPAWQVPEAYIFLAIVLWIIISNWSAIKQYKIKDYMLIVLMILFAGSIVIKYIYDYQSYMVAIMNTEYPGGRMELGGYSLREMYTYLVASTASFTFIDNPCEIGGFFAVFPLGLFAVIPALWKRRGKDLQLWLLMIPTALLLLYCYMPLPEKVAKLTLLSYSTPSRAQDMLAFVVAIILLVVLSRANEIAMPWGISMVIVAVSVYPAVKYAYDYFGKSKWFVVTAVGAIIAVVLLSCMLARENCLRRVSYFVMTLGLLLVAMKINPVMCGTDAVRSRPVAKEIEEIVSEDPDAKWIALNSVCTPNYLIACGAPTYNSTNYIPNMDLWEILDPEGEYNECYNRYAHIGIDLTSGETSVELAATDAITLHLSYDDLEKLDVSYIFSQAPIEKFADDKIYEEAGVYIYQIN